MQYFDWGMLGVIVLLVSAGFVTLYSAAAGGAVQTNHILYWKQMVWVCFGVMVIAACLLLDYRKLDQWAFVIYILCMLLLIGVLLFGRLAGGSRRWINLGFVSLQPSELAKLSIIIMLAKYYAKKIDLGGLTLRELAFPAAATAVPFVLIVKQPDLGTAMLLLLIAGSITLFIKIERRSLLYLASAAGVAVPLVWHYMLKDYQKMRILTFLNPDRDPLGTGYHIIQSKIAIGSGMTFGKGLLKGTQNVLSFLPEQHTDFIFSVLAEEWGFIGAVFVILVFLLLVYWGMNIAYRCRDPFGVILAVGVSSMVFWQTVINIGMVMGLMPVVGVPLPFISYGGSSVVTMMIGIGILMNISMRRFSAR